MITEKQLEDLDLPSYENGYYSISDDMTVDVEGDIRVELDSKRLWIGKVFAIKELQLFIELTRR